MLYFHWEYIDSKLKKIQGILQTVMLAPLLFNLFLVGMETSKENLKLYVSFSTIQDSYFIILLFINGG